MEIGRYYHNNLIFKNIKICFSLPYLLPTLSFVLSCVLYPCYNNKREYYLLPRGTFLAVATIYSSMLLLIFEMVSATQHLLYLNLGW